MTPQVFTWFLEARGCWDHNLCFFLCVRKNMIFSNEVRDVGIRSQYDSLSLSLAYKKNAWSFFLTNSSSRVEQYSLKKEKSYCCSLCFFSAILFLVVICVVVLFSVSSCFLFCVVLCAFVSCGIFFFFHGNACRITSVMKYEV